MSILIDFIFSRPLVQVQAAYIAAVRQENDSNPFPRDLYDKSIIVMTRGGREVKFTAKDKERHDLWYQVCLFGLSYILAFC